MPEYKNPGQENHDNNNNDKYKAVIAVVVVLLLIVGVVFLWPGSWRGNRSRKSPETAGEEKQASGISTKIKIKAETPIDYKTSQELMAKRKAALGLDKGIDMIVRPGETIRIGEMLVSIDEILDKIRLKTGEIDEQSLSDQPAGTSAARRVELPAALDRLKALEKEYNQLKTRVKSTSGETDSATRRHLEKLSAKLRTYHAYQDVRQNLDDARQRLAGAQPNQVAGIKKEIDALTEERTKLEKTILAAMQADQDLNAYGIHVVKPGDNIWNIHFQFLKDYFLHKGVTLSPGADEAGVKGQSSGVGRLLKFSESMVHIYNLREKRIDPDLNLIHPLSKIVVFNLAKVFELLESINFNEVDRIRFDGEMLWLPAKND